MDKLIIASMHKNAGKTSLIVGMAKELKKSTGYVKPFGDRLVYKKKRLWDYDSALLMHILGLEDDAENMSIGFDHSKLTYMYDEQKTKDKLKECISKIQKDLLFIESGGNIMYGASVHLDALTLAKETGGKLFVVLSGEDHAIMDDAAFLKKSIDVQGINFGGVVLNKIRDMEDFREVRLPQIKKLGLEVVGMIPHRSELTHFSVSYLAESLFAKVITGEEHLDRIVKNIFIGAMSANVALQKPLFKKENKLIITGGDRSDMILAALETGSVAVILTNNIIPEPDIVSKAADKKIPLLLVPFDTFEVARRIDELEPLLTKNDNENQELLGKLVGEHVDLKRMVEE
ncbi:MAG: DRTGG domain-containing protein [Candidatus Micrarchaeota archaeon]